MVQSAASLGPAGDLEQAWPYWIQNIERGFSGIRLSSGSSWSTGSNSKTASSGSNVLWWTTPARVWPITPPAGILIKRLAASRTSGQRLSEIKTEAIRLKARTSSGRLTRISR